jgi:Undecaprenyl-phosphate glucose phosphotransferase
MILLMAGWYMIAQIHFSRSMMAIFFVINIILTTLGRTFIRTLLQYFRKKGYNLKYILLVGYSRAGEEYINRINSNPQWGYVVRGILDDSVPAGTVYKGVKVLGTIENLLYILPQNKLDEIAITLSLKDYDHLEHIVDLCEKSGVHTKFIPDYNSLFPSRPYTEDLMGLPVINIRYVPLTNTLNWYMKRLVDIVVALVGVIVSSPVMFVAAIGIACTSRGPIIFRQERIGLHNKPFKMYKFRTMYVQKPSQEKQAWTTKDDPRVTKIGKFLRRTSIDELPQLFNILKGDMSVVGPRPERPQFVEKFKEEIPRYMVKHQVRPGLTGWAQINGYRGDTSIKRRIEYDIFYIENWTMSFDIKIMILTLFKGLINKNAY